MRGPKEKKLWEGGRGESGLAAMIELFVGAMKRKRKLKEKVGRN